MEERIRARDARRAERERVAKEGELPASASKIAEPMLAEPLLTQPVAVAVEAVAVPGEGPQPDFPGKISAEYLHGCWACCCIPLGCNFFKKFAAGPDNYREEGCCLLFGVIPRPYTESYERLPGTNRFVNPQKHRQGRGFVRPAGRFFCHGLGCTARLC